MVWVPAPAVEGLNVPKLALVIPVPLQVPPPVAADKLIEASAVQNGPVAVMVAFGIGLTVTITEAQLVVLQVTSAST